MTKDKGKGRDEAKTKTNLNGSRRAQVANACTNCRGCKVKCSGQRPICARCYRRGLQCEYDVASEGMTKRQHLRHELCEQTQELERANTVLDVLLHGTDEEASGTLARLRMDHSLQDECSHIKARVRAFKMLQCAMPQSIPNPSLSSSQSETIVAELSGSSPEFIKDGYSPQPPLPLSPTWIYQQARFGDATSSREQEWSGQGVTRMLSPPVAWNQPVSPDLMRVQVPGPYHGPMDNMWTSGYESEHTPGHVQGYHLTHTYL